MTAIITWHTGGAAPCVYLTNAESFCVFTHVFLRAFSVSMLDWKTGDELSFPAPFAFLLQDANIWQLIKGSPLTLAVMGVLFCFSIYSWTIIFAKWNTLRGARGTN